jgi:acetyltransferase-like isoleucine patch superfamily enzyme
LFYERGIAAVILDSFIVKIKRAETPFYARLKRLGKAILTFQVPIPRALDPIYAFVLNVRRLKFDAEERINAACYAFPVLRTRCVSIGKRLRIDVLPQITGPVKVYLGDDVRLSGWIVISGGRVFDEPEFRVGNRSFIGGNCLFSVAKSITIGDDVLIAGGCNVSDYSAHPLDPVKRIAGEQVDRKDVRPVHIGNKVWIGRGATILPGVTIGDGGVVGAATVVIKDVPPGCICVGNPGRLVSRIAYEPQTERTLSRV